MGVIAKRYDHALQRGDVLNDDEGRQWRFDCVTRARALICQPTSGGPPKILPPHRFPGLVIEEV